MKGRKLFWGLFFLAAAAFLIASQLASFATLSAWTIIVAILLVAVLIQSAIYLNFFGITLPLAVGYWIFQGPLGFYHISFWILLVAAVFLSIGLEMLFGRYKKKNACSNSGRGGHSHGGIRPDSEVVGVEDDNHPYARVSFGETSQYLHATALESGRFECSFGSMEVYLDQAKLAPAGATLDLYCNFGSIKLYIPRDWQVRDEIGTTLAAVENNARFAKPGENTPLLNLIGSVSFGAIEIQYV